MLIKRKERKKIGQVNMFGVFVCLDGSQGQALEVQHHLFVYLDFVGACAAQNPNRP